MARRRRKRKSFGAISIRVCPREGSRVMFVPNPVSRLMYSRKYGLPKVGEVGTVTKMPGFARTCMKGPGGGLVYVKWPSVGTLGVSSFDLDKVKGRR